MVRKIPSRECTRKKNLLRSSLPSSPQVYKPLFEAMGDGSGGKSLEDVFYEREVRRGARPLTLGASPRPGRRWALCPAGPVALLRWGSRTCPGLRRARRRSAEKAAVPASRGGAGGRRRGLHDRTSPGRTAPPCPGPVVSVRAQCLLQKEVKQARRPRASGELERHVPTAEGAATEERVSVPRPPRPGCSAPHVRSGTRGRAPPRLSSKRKEHRGRSVSDLTPVKKKKVF